MVGVPLPQEEQPELFEDLSFEKNANEDLNFSDLSEGVA